jgi:ABC-type uncharacterized transport system substrate-binding protein
MRLISFLLYVFMWACSSQAQAHPHVWVAMRSELIFGADGRLHAVRHHWTFDDMYSAFAVQGLGPEGQILSDEQLLPLAKTNVEQLVEYNYFTFVKVGGKPASLLPATDYALHEDEKKLLTLTFTVPLASPASASKALVFQVYDPSYFVDFTFERSPNDTKDVGVTLVDASKGCSLSVFRPKPLGESEQKALNEAFFADLSPGEDFGIKLADRAIVACP